MKKLLLILSIAILFTSCTSIPPAADPEKKEDTVEDYFPFLENTRLSYAGEGNEYAEKEVYFDFIEGKRAQIRTSNPGTTLAQVYEVSDAEVRLVSTTEEMYVFYNMLENLMEEDAETPSTAEVVLKEPLVEGTQWTLSDGRTREITGVQVPIETPHADYEAIEVTTMSEGEAKTLDYYAIGVGLVKSVFISDDYEIITALKSVEKDTAMNLTLRLYYPDFTNEIITFVEEEVEFQTNDEIKALFQTRLKQAPGDDIQVVLGENVEINELIYNPEDESVTVDFNRNLVTEMNAGVFLESQILSSITTTLGDYFNVPKVYIRIEGKPYESGHVLLEEDDYLTPRIEEAVHYDQR